MFRALRPPLVLSLLVALVFPMPAAAQFGGLKKKIKEAAGLEPAFTPKPAPAFNDRILEITPERLDRLVAGLDAEAASAKTAEAEYTRLRAEAEGAEARYQADTKAYQQSRKTYDACYDKFMNEELAKAAANESALETAFKGMDDERWYRYVEDLAKRGERIAKKVMAGASDPVTMQEHEAFVRETKVMQREQERRAKLAMAGMEAENRRAETESPRLVAACGKQPAAPVRPGSDVTGPESVLLLKGSQTANLEGKENTPEMKRRRYEMMRERVLYFVTQKQRPSGMGYSAGEFELLTSRAGELDDLAKRLRKAGVSL